MHGQQYAALLFQALHAIPQVRESFLQYDPPARSRSPEDDPGNEFEGSEQSRTAAGASFCRCLYPIQAHPR